MFRLLPFAVFILFLAADVYQDPAESGVSFRMRGSSLQLSHPMRGNQGPFFPRDRYTDEELDTLSNWYSAEKRYVEFVRQDDPLHPTLGLALGFEFDEQFGEYPYTPAHARLQIRDFRWGGLEFSRADTANFTGVSDAVCNDFTLEIDSFANDTFYGRFNGLLLSGAGKMLPIDSGFFRIGVYRVD
jgi:hypothetical protein